MGNEWGIELDLTSFSGHFVWNLMLGSSEWRESVWWNPGQTDETTEKGFSSWTVCNPSFNGKTSSCYFFFGAISIVNFLSVWV